MTARCGRSKKKRGLIYQNLNFAEFFIGLTAKTMNGILLFGANGSGKTTLGRELARILNFKHIDHENYAFEEMV